MKAESIKAKLKNLSDESGRPFQEPLPTMDLSERFIGFLFLLMPIISF